MTEAYPADLHYTAEHEWVRLLEGAADAPPVVRFGITHYAQEALGDIVFVTLPAVGASVTAGQACGEDEPTNAGTDGYPPCSGTVVARNDAVETSPETLNSDPYGSGWLADVQIEDPAVLTGLLDVEAYRAATTG